jgi:TRAP-type mannitol/chloroaromatic compound transport system substrate-binding protein
MLSEFTARNNAALVTLIEEHGVELRELPGDVMQRLKTISGEVVAESAQHDELSKRIYASYMAYAKAVRSYHEISEQAYLNAR